MKRKWLLWIPLGAYLVFLGIASLGLKRDEQQIILSMMLAATDLQSTCTIWFFARRLA